MPEIIANTKAGDYPILIVSGALRRLGAVAAENCRGRSAFVVTDETVADLYLKPALASLRQRGFVTSHHAVPPGEASKSPATLMTLYEKFHAAGLQRTDPVIALGGGVVGDLAGFAAATWLRGLPLIQVPTTLLAQVDSSIGGKTGIDLPFGKNLIGAFYQPQAVLMDPDLLRTLSRRRMAEGMAEVIKYGLIRDAQLFDQVESRTFDLEWILERCVRIKTMVVAADERDTGERMILNFGHTAGHALEKLTEYRRYSHGEAVAVGMIVACKLGESLQKTPPGTTNRLRSVLQSHQLPTGTDLEATDILDAIASDKKHLAGKIYYVLLEQIGKAFLQPMPPETLRQAMQEIDLND